MKRTALFVLGVLLAVSRTSAQIVIPSVQHETLDVEIYSLRDKLTLYMGDPQQLLYMRYRPDDIEPRVDYASQARAVLRILDSYLFQDLPPDLSTMPEERRKKYLPDSQTWEIRVTPAGPTKFALRCEAGEGSFDFTDFQTQSVHIQGEESKFDVEFVRPNPIVLESFRAHAPKGSFELRGLLNARAKEVVLFLPQSTCRVELRGKEFEGESQVLFQGPPARLRLVVSRRIGLRVKGPAATLARFAAKHMVQSGDEWESQNFAASRCRVQLTFAEEVPNLEVSWN